MLLARSSAFCGRPCPRASGSRKVGAVSHAAQGRRSARPMTAVLDSERGFGQITDMGDFMGRLTQATGEPAPPLRFFSPTLQSKPCTDELLVYLPGLDGTGMAASSQFEELGQTFEIICMSISTDSRDTVDDITAFVEERLREVPAGRPITLLGESMGGMVALAVTLRCPSLVSRIILVNPGTSYDRTPWPMIAPALSALPPLAYSGVPLVLAPFLGINPVRIAQQALAARIPPPPSQQPSPSSPASGAAAPEESVAEQAERLRIGVDSLLQDAPGGVAQLQRAISALSGLADILPPDTLSFRLSLLAAGCAAVNARLSEIEQPAFIFVGGDDWLIPSADEGPRLAAALQDATLVLVPGATHMLLQDSSAEANLVAAMRRTAFIPSLQRPPAADTTGEPDVAGVGGPESTSSGEGRSSDDVSEGSTAEDRKNRGGYSPGRLGSDMAASGGIPGGFGAAASANGFAGGFGVGGPGGSGGGAGGAEGGAQKMAARKLLFGADAMPTAQELEESRRPLNFLRRVVSPVFFSVDETGRLVQGLSAVPVGERGRGTLFVGNHQTLAPDLGFLIDQFLSERGVLLRGLAHPAVFAAGNRAGGPAAGAGPGGSAGAGGTGGAGMFTRFGAVPVSGKNLYRLLEAGENVLLFPGGVREAYKRKGEEYKLFWPERPEFVRLAAKLGATIVPFSAIGADDSIDMILDADEILKNPILGDLARQQQARMPTARAGDGADAAEVFISPLALPRRPNRYYFLFGKPIRTEGRKEALMTPEGSRELYAQVKGEVERGLRWLLARRERDPFKDVEWRLLFETAWGKAAPTFPMPTEVRDE